ncbi:MAG: hypothetical protein HLUCCO02_09000 [Idiomarinaceae bacterium HL-53]|nr:MAG: hypothetical protein HLUCCO02_09000 [Idiomarinaceae bacterium HL-53]CUS47669.1 hypothetical protein Ga0003345_0602 [Idiomarinaceae bacterium HL-53]
MKKSRFAETQIISNFKESDAGIKVEQINSGLEIPSVTCTP